MLVNGDEIIAAQLTVAQETEMTLGDGRKTVLRPFRTVARLDDAALRLSLNGQWRCRRWPFDDAEARLVAADCDDAAWPSLAQPGKVFFYDPEEDPTGQANWDRVKLTHLDPDDGAVLRRRVRLPATWRGRRVFLRFDAVFPAARFFLNGVFLGEHLAGLTPVEFDVSHLVAGGDEAVVAIRLLRRHPHVQLDMPRHALEFAGISQDACFHAVGQCRIERHHLVATLHEDCRTGSLAGTVTLRNDLPTALAGKLKVELRNPRHRRCQRCEVEVALAAAETREVAIQLDAGKVDPWNDEYPHLYAVTMVLAMAGQAPEQVCYRTGFRRFELRDERPFLNGRPVKFRGVNHLTFHPEGGMHTPTNWLRRNLLLMKRANVNCIRTHFLGPEPLADLCDELGIYLVQELPFDWGTNYVHDPAWLGPGMMRFAAGVTRDRHHPAVMVWALGNENLPQDRAARDDGFNHLRILGQLVKRLDPTRPIMFPPPGPANKIKGIFETRFGADIADTHYSFDLVRAFNATGVMENPETWAFDMVTTTRAEARAAGWSGVWFSSEYGIFNYQPDLLNAPYLSVISDTPEEPLSGKNTQQAFMDRLEREWGYMRDDPTCLGGAYFPWLCAGAGDPWGWTRWGEDADWGVVTADLTPKPAFWVMRVIFSPVRFPARVSWRGLPEISVPLHNGYNRIDLKACTLRTMMCGRGGRWMGQMRQWQDVPISGPPGETTAVAIPLWHPQAVPALTAGETIIVRCILLDPSGFRPVMADVMVVPGEVAETVAEIMPVGPDAKLD